MKPRLRFPSQYFGGKSMIAPRVWELLGDPYSYIEPFVGSGAVLLARPESHVRVTETVNDYDGMLCNVWRSLQLSPEETAKHASWIVSELDLHARHDVLIPMREPLTERLRADPEWHDPKAAGWWLWGSSCWIGSGWCAEGKERGARKRPHLHDSGCGVHSDLTPRQLPHLAGQGVNRALKGSRSPYGIPFTDIPSWFAALSERLRRVRIICGDWERACTRAVVFPKDSGYSNRHAAVFLDPPYSAPDQEGVKLYACGAGCASERPIRDRVEEWCNEWGKLPNLRIILCGYADEYTLPGWGVEPWKGPPGYANQGDNSDVNRAREVLYLSPAVLQAGTGRLSLW